MFRSTHCFRNLLRKVFRSIQRKIIKNEWCANTSFADVTTLPREPESAEDTMAKAVGPLEREMVERVRPVPSWTSLPAAGSTDNLKAQRKSIPKMAIWTSAAEKST
jgi:hypothetical protein